jgi:hypothetical protein
LAGRSRGHLLRVAAFGRRHVRDSHATCATVARQAYRDAVSEVGLGADLLEDGVLMASEFAANTLHAQAVAGVGGGGESARVRNHGRGGQADLVRRPRPSGARELPATVASAPGHYPTRARLDG